MTKRNGLSAGRLKVIAPRANSIKFKITFHDFRFMLADATGQTPRARCVEGAHNLGDASQLKSSSLVLIKLSAVDVVHFDVNALRLGVALDHLRPVLPADA